MARAVQEVQPRAALLHALPVPGRLIELRPVDDATRPALLALDPRSPFVAPVETYLALDGWHPLAVVLDGDVAGFVMWAIDPADGSHWIGGLLVDPARRRRGVGRAAVLALLERFREAGAPSAALSYAPGNAAARELYVALGFAATGERTGDGEVVARLALP